MLTISYHNLKGDVKMKNIFILICSAVMLFMLVACGGAGAITEEVSNEPASRGIEAGEGEFFITPDEFIEIWNERLAMLKENNPDSFDIQRLLFLPAFIENGKSILLNDTDTIYGLSVTYTTNDAGNLSELRFRLSSSGREKDRVHIHNFIFIGTELPAFFNPDTQIDLSKKFSIASDIERDSRMTDRFSVFDGYTEYTYSTFNAIGSTDYSIMVSPKWPAPVAAAPETVSTTESENIEEIDAFSMKIVEVLAFANIHSLRPNDGGVDFNDAEIDEEFVIFNKGEYEVVLIGKGETASAISDVLDALYINSYVTEFPDDAISYMSVFLTVLEPNMYRSIMDQLMADTTGSISIGYGEYWKVIWQDTLINFIPTDNE